MYLETTLLGSGVLRSLNENVVDVESRTTGVCCAHKTLLKLRKAKTAQVLRFILRLKIFNIFYKFFRASLMIISTVASGCCAIIFATTLSDCFLANPKTSSADNASSLFVLFERATVSSMS